MYKSFYFIFYFLPLHVEVSGPIGFAWIIIFDWINQLMFLFFFFFVLWIFKQVFYVSVVYDKVKLDQIHDLIKKKKPS